MQKVKLETLIHSEVADFFSGVQKMQCGVGGPKTIEEAIVYLQGSIANIFERAQQPVAWTDAQELADVEEGGLGYMFKANPITPHADLRRVIKLYTAPMPIAVPDEIPDSVYEVLQQACGERALMHADALWNACLAAIYEGGAK